MADDKTPKHYLNKKGQDLFDEWHDRVSMDVMREIMRFTSERYVRRYDRKNGIEDLEKGINVLERLKEYEIAEEEKPQRSKALEEHLKTFKKEAEVGN